MKIFKSFFFLTSLLLVFSMTFTIEAQAQNRKANKPAMVFNAEDMSLWETAKIPARLPDGEVLLATFAKSGTRIVALVRGGKVVRIGQKNRKGVVTPLVQKSILCFIPNCRAYAEVRCYVFKHDGQYHCICICMGSFTIGN